MKVFVIIILFACFGIKGFSQSLDSTVVKNDPKAQMWKKIRAETVNNDSNSISTNRFPDPGSDKKTIYWNKQRSGLAKNVSVSKVYTNEEIRIIEQNKKNEMYRKQK